MNSFVFSGILVRKESKTSQRGKTYWRIEVQEDEGRGGQGQNQNQPIPLTCFKVLDHIYDGSRVVVTGRLKGSLRGQYLNLDADSVEVFSDMNHTQGYGTPARDNPQCNKYDNPDFQPRRNPPQSTFDAPPSYGDLSRVAGTVANHTRPPEPRLNHDDRGNMDEDGNLIPF